MAENKKKPEWIEKWKKERENKDLIKEEIEIDTEVYDKLQKEADELGIDVQDLMDLLIELGLLRAINEKLNLEVEVYQDMLKYKKFTDENKS